MQVPEADEDSVFALADLAGRAGARSMQIGYLDDDPPHRWYAHVQYRGARIAVENHATAAGAADALCEKILTGARCTGCGGLVALSDEGAVAYEHPVMADGTKWSAGEAARAGLCRWRRTGREWVMGCKEKADAGS